MRLYRSSATGVCLGARLEVGESALEQECQVPADRRIANVFRVGRIRDSAVAESPRLRVSELLV